MRGWKILFWVAAAFNLCIGFALMIMPQLSYPAADASALMPVRAMGWFIAVFGVGYAIVANAPERHHGLVKIGVVGKLGFVVLMLAAWSSGDVPNDQLLTSLLDLPWVVAFILFLRREARS